MDIFGRVLGGIIGDALAGQGVKKPIVTAVTKEVLSRAQEDPVIQNQMNMEAPWQSRVVVGSTIGMIGAMIVAIAHLVEMFQSGNLDVNMAMVEIGTIWGVGYALYGRLVTGLSPLFGKK